MRLSASTLCLAGALVLAVTGGCRDARPNVVHFGAILSRTGPAAPYGEDNFKGLQLAKETINEQGGIDGKAIDIDVQDSAGDPGQAVLLAQRFAANPQILAILGPTRTGDTLAVARLLPSLRIPMMSVGSTGVWPAKDGGFNEWTLRSTRVDTYLTAPLLRVARDRFGVKRVAIVYTANDDWSVSVVHSFEESMRALGLQLVAEESQLTGDTDRRPQLTKIIAANPDGLIVDTLSTDAPTIASQARQLGFQGLFIGTAGFTNPETWNLARPGVLEGTLLADNFFAGSMRPAAQEFVRRYRVRFGKDAPPYAAYAFDGLQIVAAALKRTPVPWTRDGLRQALGSTKDYDGVLGNITYHGRGDAEKGALILRIEKNGYVQLN
jgi:branched-chain amino acid transport system substrate-binding protein